MFSRKGLAIVVKPFLYIVSFSKAGYETKLIKSNIFTDCIKQGKVGKDESDIVSVKLILPIKS